MKNYCNKCTKTLPSLNVGDKVYFKEIPDPSWVYAGVTEISPFPRSYVVWDQDGREYHRNKYHKIQNSRSVLSKMNYS